MGIISKSSSGVKSKPKPFPKLMTTEGGRIGLFQNKHHAVILVVGDGSGHYEGYTQENLAPDLWKDYDGTVTLSNE